MKLKTIIFIIIILILSPGSMVAQTNTTEITGKVVERLGYQPIEFATVILKDANSEKVITGTTTTEDGTFEIATVAPDFYIEVTFIGFNPSVIKDFQVINNKADLGTILLAENSTALDEVVVRGERSQMEFRLDKRVYNVGKDLSSTGASALEVLNNVPSVNVNIEGEISLRGSTGVQILINGKPSVLTNEGGSALSTLTAEMIDRIEVITNPSAKYDAEGTSGIINIVVKKEERKGTNGSVTLNTGVPHNHSFGLSLNRRTEKFNLFSQIGVGYRELPNDVDNINRDLVNNTTVITHGEEFRNENFYNVILGTDYYINRLNVLTVSGHLAYEIEDQPSFTNFEHLDGDENVTSRWQRDEDTEATNPKYQYELQYKREYEDHEDHALLFSALGSFFGKDQSSDFTNTTLSGADNDGRQQTRTDFQEGKYTFKLDYTKPFSDQLTLETGSQYVIQNVSNDYEVTDLVDGVWVTDLDQTNIFEYDQGVFGVYGTGAYEEGPWGFKLGLRLENTDLNTFLINTNEENNQNYTNLFPSVHTSYKITENYSLQAGYSRRVRRPRLWDLNPFFNIRNNFTIRTGNPDLQPEFTDSYEITNLIDLEKTSLSYGIYHRYTTDVIERVSTFENSVNTFKPVNLGTNRATGIEFNTKYTPNKTVTINGDFNFNYFMRRGALESTSFDFDAEQWSTKLTTKFKLPAGIDFEMTGHYRSGFQTVQSEISDNIFADLGLRKKIMKSRGVINLGIRDVFASRVFESETVQPEFFVYNRRQRGRFVTIGFSYGFGKGEAMEFSGWKRF